MLKKILRFLSSKGFFNFLDDRNYLKLKYWSIIGKKINLKKPKTFNEKLQWLKLYDRKDIYTTMVDKYEAKKFVGDIIGKDHIIPTIGIYNKFEDINFNNLPNQFVIKCTHDSGGLVIVKDKENLNIKEAKKKINKSLKKNYYWYGREWPYKSVKPRILIEKYMEDEKDKTMRDYKFFCFNGIPKIMYLSEGMDSHDQASMSFFDMNFKEIDCKRKDYKPLQYKPTKPKNFEKMKEYSSKLSKNIPHLRVDFYEIDGNLYFGELTFFTCSGFLPFDGEKWNKTMGDWIILPEGLGEETKNEK